MSAQSPPAPQNLDAEEHVLGAMMLSRKAIEAVSAVLVDGAAFYRESHAVIYRAAVGLHARDEPVDAVTLTAELERRDELREIPGGHIRINELAALVPAAGNAAHYARIVAEKATARDLLSELTPLAEQARNGGLDLGEARAALERALTALPDDLAKVGPERLLSGDKFILDHPRDVPAIWRGAAGVGTAWAQGEPFMLCGPDGVGKTTLMQQLTLGRIGLRERVLGMRLAVDERPVLYLALDRPAQIARSFARMVSEDDREVLRERLIFWKGPPPFDVLKSTRSLADFAETHGAGTVVIDSLKDLASKLTDDEVGGRVNNAIQEAIARSVEVGALHHQRKAQPGAPAPRRLADVYGSRWLTAGMGSVFMLWAEPGDLEVELFHLKQPDEELGPWKLLHDHNAGKTVIFDQVDLLAVVTAHGHAGITADQAAALLFDSAMPSRNEVEKARRRLEKLTEQRHVTKEGQAPNPVVYRRQSS